MTELRTTATIDDVLRLLAVRVNTATAAYAAAREDYLQTPLGSDQRTRDDYMGATARYSQAVETYLAVERLAGL